MPIAVGETFERYEIESLIGRGGMGDVYRAVDTRLRRKVALKVLRPDRAGDEAVARLFREARSAASFAHPNTVAVHDIGEAEGISYIVMELVSGAPLLAFVGDERVPVARRLGWLVDAARALSAAHKAGVIHRDVKPSNIMVSDEGIVKVLDFGLAKSLAPVSFRTQQGHVLGTPRYMSPEQLAGDELDARSDQYAYALTAYELLSGKHPGGALSGTAAPPMLDLVVPQITRSVAQVINKAISTRPTDRFSTMEEVVVALEDAIAGRPVRGLADAMSESAMSTAPATVVDAEPFGAAGAVTASAPDLEAVEPTVSAPAPPSRPADKSVAKGATLPLGQPTKTAPTIATLLSADAAAQRPAMTTLLEAGAVKPAKSAEPPPSERVVGPPITKTPVVAVALVVLGVVAFAGAYIVAKQQLGGSAPSTSASAIPSQSSAGGPASAGATAAPRPTLVVLPLEPSPTSTSSTSPASAASSLPLPKTSSTVRRAAPMPAPPPPSAAPRPVPPAPPSVLATDPQQAR